MDMRERAQNEQTSLKLQELLRLAHKEIDALKAELKAELKAAKESEQCWIFNAKALQRGYNELDAKHRELKAENEKLRARIDNLMMEYCPEEMSVAQWLEWGKNQTPVSAAMKGEKS